MGGLCPSRVINISAGTSWALNNWAVDGEPLPRRSCAGPASPWLPKLSTPHSPPMPTASAGSGCVRKPSPPTWSARAPGFTPPLPSWKSRAFSCTTASTSKAASGPAATAFRTVLPAAAATMPNRRRRRCQNKLTPLYSPLTRVITTNQISLSQVQHASRLTLFRLSWFPPIGSRPWTTLPGQSRGIRTSTSWPSRKASSCLAEPRATATPILPPHGGAG